MKTCSTCKQSLPVSDFYKSKRKGHQTYCKSCANKRRAEWARQNTHKTRDYRLKYNYGLSAEKFDKLLEKQNNACGLCKKQFTDQDSIHVDHDHECCNTGTTCGRCVRGLLHARCNRILGYFESITMQTQIKEYLSQPLQALK